MSGLGSVTSVKGHRRSIIKMRGTKTKEDRSIHDGPIPEQKSKKVNGHVDYVNIYNPTVFET